mmetsp:Transcript_27536/g.64574  ORF Transcript_27536/g.64574 Transcript_27536/m.64574 type:complete len:207 (-) Transcript_27536:1028-1648(-)
MIPSHSLVAKQYTVHFGTFDTADFSIVRIFVQSGFRFEFLPVVINDRSHLDKSSPVLGFDHGRIGSWNVLDIDAIAGKFVIDFDRRTGMNPAHTSALGSNEYQTQRSHHVHDRYIRYAEMNSGKSQWQRVDGLVEFLGGLFGQAGFFEGREYQDNDSLYLSGNIFRQNAPSQVYYQSKGRKVFFGRIRIVPTNEYKNPPPDPIAGG